MLVTRVKIAGMSKYVKMMSVSYKDGKAEVPCTYQTIYPGWPIAWQLDRVLIMIWHTIMQSVCCS